jgi:hypothetical protein
MVIGLAMVIGGWASAVMLLVALLRWKTPKKGGRPTLIRPDNS